MYETARLRRVWNAGDFDLDRSRPVDLTHPTSDTGFEPIEMGRTPWPSGRELAAIRKRARLEGFEEGQREAAREASRQQTQLAGDLNRLIENLKQPCSDQVQTLTREIAKLSITIGTALYRHALDIDPQRIVPIVRDAVEMLAGSEMNITITLHPADAKICRELLQQDGDPDYEILDDESIDRGGFRVNTNVSEVDATIQARVEKLMDTMYDTGNLMEAVNARQ